MAASASTSLPFMRTRSLDSAIYLTTVIAISGQVRKQEPHPMQPASSTSFAGWSLVPSGLNSEVKLQLIRHKEADDMLKGDVNGDGKVDISDVVAIINTMAGDTTFKETADVNEDTVTDISDVVNVINIMAGVGF